MAGCSPSANSIDDSFADSSDTTDIDSEVEYLEDSVYVFHIWTLIVEHIMRFGCVRRNPLDYYSHRVCDGQFSLCSSFVVLRRESVSASSNELIAAMTTRRSAVLSPSSVDSMAMTWKRPVESVSVSKVDGVSCCYFDFSRRKISATTKMREPYVPDDLHSSACIETIYRHEKNRKSFLSAALPSNRLSKFFHWRSEERVFFHFVRWQMLIGDATAPETILTQLIRSIMALLTFVTKTRERRTLTGRTFDTMNHLTRQKCFSAKEERKTSSYHFQH